MKNRDNSILQEVRIYNNGVVGKMHNKRITISVLESGAYDLQIAGIRKESPETSSTFHQVIRGSAVVDGIALKQETFEAVIILGNIWLRHLEQLNNIKPTKNETGRTKE